MQKLAGVVILYYPTKRVVNNIKSYLTKLDKLYIIDNTPKNNKILFTELKKTEYVFNNDNLGMATGLNIGAKKATDDGYEWLLTMDQDSSFTEGEFHKLVKSLFNLPKNLNVDLANLALISPYHMTKYNHEKNLQGYDEPVNVMTSGNIINLDIYKKIGGFKDWLFIDCVDFDYCMNAKISGYRVIRCKDVKLNHNLGDIKYKNFLGRKVFYSNHNYIRRYYITRNRSYIVKMYKKHFPFYCKLEKQATRSELIKIILFEKEKYQKVKYILKGKLDYLRGKKGRINIKEN